jgi:hypothetical protein
MRPCRRVAVLAIFVIITLFFPLLAPPAHRIDDEHCQLIQSGMTEAEVEGIFGVPAGSYDCAVEEGSSQWYLIVLALDVHRHRMVAARHAVKYLGQEGAEGQRFVIKPEDNKLWISRHGSFCVTFDSEGRVWSNRRVGDTRIEPPWKRWWAKLTAK